MNLHLMPLWWRTDRPEELTVRALHDGKEIALLLVVGGRDARRDGDAAAGLPRRGRRRALALTPDPPFFAMGQPGAARRTSGCGSRSGRPTSSRPSRTSRRSTRTSASTRIRTSSSRRSSSRMRHALTLESDPTFVTAWGAGNIVADPTRRSAAEDLTAQGFGTLRARPTIDQSVVGQGRLRRRLVPRAVYARPLAGQGGRRRDARAGRPRARSPSRCGTAAPATATARSR